MTTYHELDPVDAKIAARNVSVFYGEKRAIDDVSIDIGPEYVTAFIGPSGCGKSTLLRTIAGLEDITEGTLTIGNRVVNDVPPAERGIEQLEGEAMALMNGREPPPPTRFPHRVAFNVVPQVGPVGEDGTSAEERLLAEDLEHGVHGGGRLEGGPSRQALVQNRPQRVDVRRRREVTATARLFGGHVSRGAENDPGDRAERRHGRRDRRIAARRHLRRRSQSPYGSH